MADPKEPIEDEVDDVADDAGADDAGADDAGADDEAADAADDAGADDEAADDADDAGDGKGPVEDESGKEPAAASRKENRVAKLSRERNELREKLAAAEAVAAERGRPAPVNTEAARKERDEKLALMDPSERKDFLRDEQMQQMQQTVLLTQLQTQDAMDRSSYTLTARANPVFAKHAAEVERRLSFERQNGRNWTREQILAQIVGEAALKAKPDKKGKDEARERVRDSKGAPVRGRSNANNTYRPGRAGESLDDLERRLENVSF